MEFPKGMGFNLLMYIPIFIYVKPNKIAIFIYFM